MEQEEKKLPKGLEEAAEEHAGLNFDRQMEYKSFWNDVDTFIAGAEWGRAKMMKKSYLATISANNTIPVLPMKDVSDLGLDYGDKVRVIVIKEDEK